MEEEDEEEKSKKNATWKQRREKTKKKQKKKATCRQGISEKKKEIKSQYNTSPSTSTSSYNGIVCGEQFVGNARSAKSGLTSHEAWQL